MAIVRMTFPPSFVVGGIVANNIIENNPMHSRRPQRNQGLAMRAASTAGDAGFAIAI
jgi:hypothetical protein